MKGNPGLWQGLLPKILCTGISFCFLGFAGLIYQGEYLLASAGQGSKTRGDYRNLISQASKWNDEAAVQLAMLQLEAGETTGALSGLRNASMGKNNWQGWEREGTILEQMAFVPGGALNEALASDECFSRVLRAYPNYERGLERKGVLALKLGRWDEARLVSQSLEALPYGKANGMYLRALAEKGSGSPDKALELFQQISSAGMISSGTLYSKARITQELQDAQSR